MSLRSERSALLERSDLRGAALSRCYTAIADAWLTGLLEQATGGKTENLALIAVGGYGRGELCPFSDLDVVLVHRGRRDISDVAEKVWYPVWDEGVQLDHSVRQPREVLAMASEDLRVALGLLDGRVVCGDPEVGEPLLAAAAAQWREQATRWLPVLAASAEERHQTQGDVAFLLEPDLKESYGGLRDIGALRAVARASFDSLIDPGAVASLEGPAAALDAARIELHRTAGRSLNRLLLQEQDQVASALGYADADQLMAAVAEAGRTVAWMTDDVWLRWHAWERLPNRPGRRRGRRSVRQHEGPQEADHPSGRLTEPGIVVTANEVALAEDAEVASDPTLPLRLAAVAAEHDLPLNRAALDRLADEGVTPTTPWPEPVRAAFVRLLAGGAPAIRSIESLDHRGLLVRLLPEWAAVRNRPQRNAYHRFTVDRHLLETAANAAALTYRVSRPDLLLIGALLHDIGKGFPGDHTERGMEVVAHMGRYMGLPTEDVDTLVSLVRNHLLLPDMATRRDIDDPATVEAVVAAVGNRPTLELLAALVEADGSATGPSAWGSWKAGLVSELAGRSIDRLEEPSEGAGGREEGTGRHLATWVTDEHRRLMADAAAADDLLLTVEEPTLIVAAPDRAGLLASVTGVLAVRGLDVRSADASNEEGVAVEKFVVEPAQGRWPDTERLQQDLRAAIAGHFDMEHALAERERTYGPRRDAAAQALTPQVTIDNSASAVATVIEVRARDRIGLLHRITRALFDCHLDVRTARVSTLGHEVVDAFYVRDAEGSKIRDPVLAREVKRSIVACLDGRAADASPPGADPPPT